MKRMRRILHPSDFSRASVAALNRAADLARANKAELLLVHVMSLPLPTAGDGYISPKLYEEMEASVRQDATRRLVALAVKAKKAGARVKTLLLTGNPYEQIAKVAKAKRADLVVMGTHGRTGLARFFLGSVAERVVATAACPVMTVRGK